MGVIPPGMKLRLAAVVVGTKHDEKVSVPAAAEANNDRKTTT